MKCILLGAGYATRLRPLTDNFPKPLLELEDGKPILNYILAGVEEIDEVDEIYLVTNAKYYDFFVEWKNNTDSTKEITIINDHTTSNEDKLGAIGDIKYVLDQTNIQDDLLIIAGDNLFTYPLKNVISYYKTKKAPIVCVKDLKDDVETLKRFAVATLDENNKIVGLIEKPEIPPTQIGVYATYVYPQKVIEEIHKYIELGMNPDSPGRLVEYLYKVMPCYAYCLEEDAECYDVGTIDSYNSTRAKMEELNLKAPITKNINKKDAKTPIQ